MITKEIEQDGYKAVASIASVYDNDCGSNLNIFRCEIGNKEYSFNVDYVPEDSQEWFIDVVGKQFLKSHVNGIMLERKRIQSGVKELFGL